MGKSKNKRHKASKPNPICQDDMAEKEFDISSLQTSDILQAMIEKLQNGTTAEEHESACFTLSNLASEKESISILMEHKIVKIAGPLLVNVSASVRLAVSGALRNLSVTGGHNVCEAMVKQDIMTPLIVLLKQYSNGWKPLSKKDQDCNIDLQAETFIQAVHLLWNLCESSSSAVDIFNREDILPTLYYSLDIGVYGLITAITVAHCLFTLSEDNVETFSILENSTLKKLIYGLGKERMGFILYKILLGGILFNMNKEVLEGVSDVRNVVMDVLAETLGINCIYFLTSLAHSIEERNNNNNLTDAMQVEEVKNIDGEIEEVVYLLTAQQYALELLANICCDGTSDEEWDDMDNSDTNDDIVDDEIENGIDQPLKIPINLASETHEALIGHGLLKLAIEKVHFPEDGLLDILSSHSTTEPLVKKFLTMYSRALTCISNMLTSMDVEQLWTLEHLYKLWINLGQLAMKHNPVPSVEFLDSVTNAMRAVLEKFVENKTSQFQLVTDKDLQSLFNVAQAVSDDNIRINIIRIVGILGCLLGASEDTRPMIAVIGQYLLNITIEEDNCRIVAEALDAIFDVYSEDYTDRVVEEILLLQRLLPVVQSYKHKVSQQRKHLKHHLPIIKTAQINLQRFIDYKTKTLIVFQNRSC